MRERSHARGLTASYLEPDRYDDDVDLEQSLLEMKKQYKKGIAKGNLLCWFFFFSPHISKS